METSGLTSAFLVILMINAAFALEGNLDNDEALFKRSTCKDKSRWCQWYRNRGYCARNHKYYTSMKKNCPVTCAIPCDTKPVTEPVGNGIETVRVNLGECLQAHNSKRALHGALPLTWDPTLARQAQAYAIKLAQIGTYSLPHDPNKGNVGENLEAFSLGLKITTYCKDAMKEWYNKEVDLYPFSNPPLYANSDIAHFTQVVWKSTKRFGVGIAKNRFIVYIVARYTPPGNKYKYFAQNVGNKRRG